MPSENLIHILDLEADLALFSGEIQGLAFLFYRNERPLAGLAGLLDWRFQGALSKHLRAGAITGECGQCAYLPITRHGQTFHLLAVGAGESLASGIRDRIPLEALHVLQKNLLGLKIPRIGLSRKDFSNQKDDYFLKQLRGCELWIVN